MSRIVIITCFNNKQMLEQMKNSVYKESGISEKECKIFAIDNTKNKFSSAAKAYNYALRHVTKAEVLVFCHQDILFLEHSIEDIIQVCLEYPETLFGAAGVKNVGNKRDNRIISHMAMIKPEWKYETLEEGTTEEVFTLDECLIAGTSELFKRLVFDETVCDGWHLYAADLCMDCKRKGIPVKVYDANIAHLSGGNPDKSFYECERKFVKKYRNDFKIISYSCG